MKEDIIKEKISELESKLFQCKIEGHTRLNASGCAGARYRKLVAGQYKREDRITDRIKALKLKLEV